MSDECLEALGIELLIDRFDAGDKMQVRHRSSGWSGMVNDIWIAPRRLFDNEPVLKVFISYIPHEGDTNPRTMTVPLDEIDSIEVKKMDDGDYNWDIIVSYNKHLVKRNYKR